MSREIDPDDLLARTASEHAAARRLLPDSGATARLSELAKLACTILGVPRAHISLLTDVQTIVGTSGGPLTELGQDSPLADSLCALAARSGRPMAVNDTRDDARVHAHELVTAGVVGSFCAVPLTTDVGVVVGALCVTAEQPRIWSQPDVENLQALAHAVHAELELGALTRELDVSRQRWALAIEAAGAGSFDWNLRTGQLLWDERLIELFGYDGDERFDESIESFNARLHPDDVPRVTQALQDAMDRLGDYEAEYRVVLPDGKVRQVQARGRAVGDANGRPVRVAGAAWDVSATRLAQQRAGDILEAMPVAHVGLDTDWRVTSVNSAAESLLDTNRRELVGQGVWTVLAELVETDVEAILREVAQTHDDRTFEAYYPSPVNRWIETRVVSDGAGLALYLSDVSDRHAAQQLAAEAAAHDRAVAVALQQAMLPRLPEAHHLDIRARYITAARRDQVGGDWYDAVVQPNGLVSVTVGDVSGHDIAAAGLMGQLRNMLRAFTWENIGLPSTNLRKLDYAMRDLGVRTLATCITGQITQSTEQRDRGLHTLRWTNAGNIPPLAIDADGSVQYLDTRHDLVLGIEPERERRDHIAEIPDGATLLLFTDGLVESRQADLDDRMQALVNVAERRAPLPLDDLLDAVLSEMVGEQPEDDVVVLGVRFGAAVA